MYTFKPRKNGLHTILMMYFFGKTFLLRLQTIHQIIKVPPNGKGQDWRPERPIFLIHYLKKGTAAGHCARKFKSIKCIRRSGLLPRSFPFGGT